MFATCFVYFQFQDSLRRQLDLFNTTTVSADYHDWLPDFISGKSLPAVPTSFNITLGGGSDAFVTLQHGDFVQVRFAPDEYVLHEDYARELVPESRWLQRLLSHLLYPSRRWWTFAWEADNMMRWYMHHRPHVVVDVDVMLD
jgi:hypothetical protein